METISNEFVNFVYVILGIATGVFVILCFLLIHTEDTPGTPTINSFTEAANYIIPFVSIFLVLGIVIYLWFEFPVKHRLVTDTDNIGSMVLSIVGSLIISLFITDKIHPDSKEL